ncbi:ATP-binding cassette domain-containing protein [Actinomyces ruminicola]|uniref:ATP-binding cassette domain-containing protein n=1 Tax=Actinomyces ruminicola TaxID=332524 RepID=UPI0028FCDF6F|nr:ATP-binding cassette domain-containing protein [Actinomyces ruminicola]
MSLTAPVGRSVAIVGPSGSGKSTLLSLVLGPGVPLLVSGGFGVLAYQILPMGMDKITGTTDEFAALWHPSSAFTAAALMLKVVAALVAAGLAGNLARRYVRAWRPGATAAELRG